MLSTLGRLPLGDGWWFEPKWDGFRGLCYVDQQVQLLSRRGNVLTHLCPKVNVLPSKLFYGKNVPACLVVLDKNKPAEREGRILMISASRHFKRTIRRTSCGRSCEQVQGTQEDGKP